MESKRTGLVTKIFAVLFSVTIAVTYISCKANDSSKANKNNPGTVRPKAETKQGETEAAPSFDLNKALSKSSSGGMNFDNNDEDADKKNDNAGGGGDNGLFGE